MHIEWKYIVCLFSNNRSIYKDDTCTKPEKMIVIDSESRISLVDEDNPRFSVSTLHLEEPMVFRATNMEQAMSWVLFLRSCSFSHPTMSMDSFNIISTIGKGFYGKVILAQKKDTGELYAIKTVHKKRLVQSGKVHTIMTERNILRSSSHPFVITLHFEFQTLSKFYLVLEYVFSVLEYVLPF